MRADEVDAVASTQPWTRAERARIRAQNVGPQATTELNVLVTIDVPDVTTSAALDNRCHASRVLVVSLRIRVATAGNHLVCRGYVLAGRRKISHSERTIECILITIPRLKQTSDCGAQRRDCVTTYMSKEGQSRYREYEREIASRAELPEADVIIAADGVNSRIRQEAGDFPTHDVSGSNKYIWLGTDKVFEQFNFLFVPTESGWVWAHTYGIDSVSSTFIVECAPETGLDLGFSVMSTYDALPILEGIFKEHLSGHRLIGNLGDGTEARWLNFRTISNPRWHSGKVVLIGDSAHTAHFAIGMGTTLAIEDAIVLADSLHKHSNTELAFQSVRAAAQGGDAYHVDRGALERALVREPAAIYRPQTAAI